MTKWGIAVVIVNFSLKLFIDILVPKKGKFSWAWDPSCYRTSSLAFLTLLEQFPTASNLLLGFHVTMFWKISDSCGAWKEKRHFPELSVGWLLIATFQKCQLQKGLWRLEVLKWYLDSLAPMICQGFFWGGRELREGGWRRGLLSDLDFPLGKNYLCQKSFHQVIFLNKFILELNIWYLLLI